MSKVVVGVDIGATSTEAVAYDGDWRPVTRSMAATGRGGEGARDTALKLVAAVTADLADTALERVGLGVPGSVDDVSGEVSLAVNLGLGEDRFPLAAELAARLGVPVTLENDVRAAAVGAHEHLRITGSPVRDLAFLGIGTGISAGLVLDGRLHRGRDGMAGEIGHVVVAPGAGPCACGLDGCLEVVASGTAISRLWPSPNGEPTRELFEAAERGDPRAVELAMTVSSHLVTAIHWLVMSHAVDVVVLGGGVGTSESPLLRTIRSRIQEMGERSPLARRMLAPERVIALPVELSLGALGAAVIAARRGSHGTEDASDEKGHR